MDAYLGEIRLMPYNHAPQNWMQCQGQTLSISQNKALYAVLGTTYGGNGISTFMLPDFSGTAALGTGTGAGLSHHNYTLGETVGVSTETITVDQMAAHTHTVSGVIQATGGAGGSNPTGACLGLAAEEQYGDTPADPSQNMAASSVNGGATTASGDGQSHPNLMPFLVLNMCICVNGLFPSRS